MNLYASGHMAGILNSIGESVYIAAYVNTEEALSVYVVSRESSPEDRERINLISMIEDGLLQVVDLTTIEEASSVIQFTSLRLDDGEAISAAIAVHRDWALATDDRAARRVCRQLHPSTELLTTTEMVRHWASHSNPPPSLLRGVLVMIENKANFVVGASDPMYHWWQSSRGENA
jgi:hypothetical protein